MNADDFRRLALEQPEAEEGAHMGHPDFRAGGRIFASLTADGQKGMVKLTPGQQQLVCLQEPEVYVPCPGAWGRQGCTHVVLKLAKGASVAQALAEARGNVAGAQKTKKTRGK